MTQCIGSIKTTANGSKHSDEKWMESGKTLLGVGRKFRALIEKIYRLGKRGTTWCDWPYFTVIMDAKGNFVPCDRNMPKSGGRVEFYHLQDEDGFDFNSSDFRQARLKWINRETFNSELENVEDNKKTPVCEL